MRRHLAGQLAKRGDVVENPEAAAVRADHEVVVVNHQIANRSGGHVEPQRLPVVAIVEADEDGEFGAGEEQALAHGIFADGVDGRIGQAADDLLPGVAAIVRAIDVRLQVVEADAVDGGVDGVVVEVRGVELRDLAPRRHGRAA